MDGFGNLAIPFGFIMSGPLFRPLRFTPLVLLLVGFIAVVGASFALAQNGLVWTSPATLPGTVVTSGPTVVTSTNGYPTNGYPTNHYITQGTTSQGHTTLGTPIHSQPVVSETVVQPFNGNAVTIHHPNSAAAISYPANTTSGTTTVSGPTVPSRSEPTSKVPAIRRQPSSFASLPSRTQAQTVSARIDRPQRWANDTYRDYLTTDEAFRIARQNHDLAARAEPVIAKIADENASLAERLGRLMMSRQSLSTRLVDANHRLSNINTDFDTVREKLSEYGLTPTIGLLLRHQKQQLDQWQTEDNESLFARTELSRTQDEALELELVDGIAFANDEQLRRRVDELVGPTSSPRSNTNRADNNDRQQIASLLWERARIARQLKDDYRGYHHDLDELDSAASATTSTAGKFRKLINQHVTWIRSGSPIGLADLSDGRKGLAAVFEFRHTRQFGKDLSRKLSSDNVGAAFLLSFLVAMLVVRWRLKSWLVAIGSNKKMRRSGQTKIVAAGLLTLGLAAIVPMLGYVTSWWLSRGLVTATLLQFADAISGASLIGLLIELPRQMLRPFGLVDRHLSHQMSTRERAFRGLSIAGVLMVIGTFGFVMLSEIDHGIWRESLGRFTFLAMMFVVAVTGFFALRPGKGFLCPAIEAFGGRLATGFGHLWFAIAVGFPILMGVLSAVGYGYTAGELIKRAVMTLILALVASVAWKVAKIGFTEIWQRLTGTKVEPRYDEFGLIDDPQPAPELDETRVLLKHQLGFLAQCAAVVAVAACLVSLWADVVPKIGLANPTLWTVQESVTQDSGMRLASAGDTSESRDVAANADRKTPITLLKVLSAAAVIFIAIQLSRLLPTLFDVLVLQRVDYDEGMEQLILVVGRFVLFAIGCFVACRLVGIRWATIHWLIVGATIGVGFGLQDLVRNILGGLIVLFARPVNVGDRVTVGKLTGRISSQTLRMTVLSDDDGRQLQIPNRKFLSDEVTNWRGAGKLTTVSVEVAVRREERPIDMGRMLQEWSSSVGSVLQSPGPQITLVCVGKHTQRYEVHVWTEDRAEADELQKTLLKTIRKELLERNLLAKTQPKQPSVRSTNSDASDDGLFSRRRSA